MKTLQSPTPISAFDYLMASIVQFNNFFIFSLLPPPECFPFSSSGLQFQTGSITTPTKGTMTVIMFFCTSSSGQWKSLSLLRWFSSDLLVQKKSIHVCTLSLPFRSFHCSILNDQSLVVDGIFFVVLFQFWLFFPQIFISKKLCLVIKGFIEGYGEGPFFPYHFYSLRRRWGTI